MAAGYGVRIGESLKNQKDTPFHSYTLNLLILIFRIMYNHEILGLSAIQWQLKTNSALLPVHP